jgi:hypothetical protein
MDAGEGLLEKGAAAACTSTEVTSTEGSPKPGTGSGKHRRINPSP